VGGALAHGPLTARESKKSEKETAERRGELFEKGVLTWRTWLRQSGEDRKYWNSAVWGSWGALIERAKRGRALGR